MYIIDMYIAFLNVSREHIFYTVFPVRYSNVIFYIKFSWKISRYFLKDQHATDEWVCLIFGFILQRVYWILVCKSSWNFIRSVDRDLYLKVSCTVNMDYLWLHFGNTRIKLVFGVTHKRLSFIYFSFILACTNQAVGHCMSSGPIPCVYSTNLTECCVRWVSTESSQLHGSKPKIHERD